MSLRLLIVTDHQLTREGLRLVFASEGIEIADEASTAKAAVQAALAPDLDVVLLDLQLTDSDTLEVLRQIKRKRPNLAVLMYCLHDHPFWVQRSKDLGASGYVLKGAGTSQLLEAVRQVSRGNAYWPTKVSWDSA